MTKKFVKSINLKELILKIVISSSIIFIPLRYQWHLLNDKDKLLDTNFIILILIAIFPWVKDSFTSFEGFGFKWQIEKVEKDVEFMQKILNFIISCFEIKHLENLNSGENCSNYYVDEHLLTELSHLITLDLIKSTKPGKESRAGLKIFKDIAKENNDRADFSEHFSITEKGKEYLKLFQEYNS